MIEFTTFAFESTIRRGGRTMLAIVAGVWCALGSPGVNIAAAGEPGGDCIPEWDGTIGQSGLDGRVLALTMYNGDVIAGGWFTTAGGQTVNGIARWNGAQWQPLESRGQVGVGGGAIPVVFSLTVYNGDLIVGGGFTTAGGQTVNRIARWDGTLWHPFESGGQIGVSGGSLPWVSLLKVHNGDLIVGGGFTTAGGQTVNCIVRWDGTLWHPFESGGQIGVSGIEPEVRAATAYNGDLIVGGSFNAVGGQTAQGIARWDGSSGGWHSIGSVSGSVRALSVYNDEVIVGGSFTSVGGQTMSRIARWNGAQWLPIVSGGQIGVDAGVFALTVDNGDLIVGGFFATAGGQTVNRIARWDAAAWHPLASDGQIGLDGDVRALTLSGTVLIAGGEFTAAGGQPASNIATWGCFPDRGACCVDGVAVQLHESECNALGGVFHGEGVPSGKVNCPAACLPDLNNDGAVNVLDLLQVLSAWGACP